MTEAKAETKLDSKRETRALYGKSIDELKVIAARVQPSVFTYYECNAEWDSNTMHPSGFFCFRDPAASTTAGADVHVSGAGILIENHDGPMTWRHLREVLLDRAWLAFAGFHSSVSPSTTHVRTDPHLTVKDREILVHMTTAEPLCMLRAIPKGVVGRFNAQPMNNARWDRAWRWHTQHCHTNLLGLQYFSARPQLEITFKLNEIADGSGCDSHAQLASYAMWECRDDGSAVPVPCNISHTVSLDHNVVSPRLTAVVTAEPKDDLRVGPMYAFGINDWAMWEWHARARDFPVWRQVSDSILASLLPAPVLAIVEGFVSVDGPPLMRLRSAQSKLPFETQGGHRSFFQLLDDEECKRRKMTEWGPVQVGGTQDELYRQVNDVVEKMKSYKIGGAADAAKKESAASS